MTTTIISGSPTVVYNKSGTTIDIIVGSGTTQGGATPITQYGGNTIVLASRGAGGGDDIAIKLPSGAEIGDIVQVIAIDGSGNSVAIYPPSGEEIWAQGTNNGFGVAGSSVFRKITSNRWY